MTLIWIGLVAGCASMRDRRADELALPPLVDVDHSSDKDSGGNSDQVIPVSHVTPSSSPVASFQRSLLYQPTTVDRLLLAEYASGSHQVVDVRVTTHDKLDLNGWLAVPTQRQRTKANSPASVLQQDRPLVIIFPGNAGHRAMRGPLMETFCSLGANVMIFDYRGYGDNLGDPAEPHLVQDARSIWNFATTTLNVPAQRIILYGESLGGGVATHLAGDLCAAGIEPGGLIVQSSFNTAVDAARVHYAWLPVNMLSVDRFESEKQIAHITCPYLHLHGEKDTVVPIKLGEKLFAAAPAQSSTGIQKQLVRLSESNHNDIFEHDRQQVVESLRQFMLAVHSRSSL